MARSFLPARQQRRAIVQLIEAKVREAACTDPPARQDAHPKGHGCVQAKFTIFDDLPPELRVGLFATPRSYDACGSAFPMAIPRLGRTRKGDGADMAMPKLMGVAESPPTTQDFILINHPVFAARGVVDYLALGSAGPLWRFFVGLKPLRFRLHEAVVTAAILLKRVNNLLNIRYWSMSAYRFGDSAYIRYVRLVRFQHSPTHSK